MANFEALLSPGQFKGKDKEPEQLLIDFDQYIKSVNNFFVATAKDGATDKVKIAVLQAVGGSDMVDLEEMTGKVILQEIPAVPAGEGPGAAARIPAVPVDTYLQAVAKIRAGIVKQTNQAMSRFKLFQQMAQDARKFDPWAKEVLKQAERCDWSKYGAQEAARDAVLYQTSDTRLRKKILAENLDWEKTYTLGLVQETSGKQSEVVEKTTGGNSEDANVRRLEEKLRRLQSAKGGCRTCPRTHGDGQTCPSLTSTCYACQQDGHFAGAPTCKGKKTGKEGKKKYKDEKNEIDSNQKKKPNKNLKKKVKMVESSDPDSSDTVAEISW